MLLLLMTSSDL